MRHEDGSGRPDGGVVDELSDEELMARVMTGERRALVPLAERYHRPLLGYLFRMAAGDRALAEDLVQATFTKLLSQRTYTPGRPFKPWLYAIATNLARDVFREPSSTRGDVALDERSLATRPEEAPGPEELAIRGDEGEEVRIAVGRLADEYRVTLILRYYQDLSLREIAQTLGVPLGTVKSRLSVGTRRLRAILGAPDPAEQEAPVDG